MKRFLILLALGLARCDKLDRTYLPPPGSKLAGGSPGSIQVPLEFPKETYSTTLRPLPKLTPEDTRLTVGTDRGSPGSRFQDFGAVPSTQAPLSPFQTSFKVPSTTTSYAFSQTTTFPTPEGFETTVSPVVPGLTGPSGLQPGLVYTNQGQIIPGPQIIPGQPGQQQQFPGSSGQPILPGPGQQIIPGYQGQVPGSQGQLNIPGYQQPVPGYAGQQVIPGQQTIQQQNVPGFQGQSIIPSYAGQQVVSPGQQFIPGSSQQITPGLPTQQIPSGLPTQQIPSGLQTQTIPGYDERGQLNLPGSLYQSYYPGQTVSTTQRPTPSLLPGSQSAFTGYTYDGSSTTTAQFQPVSGSEASSSVSNLPGNQFGQHLGVQPPTQSNKLFPSTPGATQGPSQSYQPNIPNKSGTFIPNVPSSIALGPQNQQPDVSNNGTFAPSTQGPVYNTPQNQVSYNQPGVQSYPSTSASVYQQNTQPGSYGSNFINNQDNISPNVQDNNPGGVSSNLPNNINQGPYNIPTSTASPQVPTQPGTSQYGYQPNQENLPGVNIPQTGAPGQINIQTRPDQRPYQNVGDQNQYQNVRAEEYPSTLTPGGDPQNIYEPGTKPSQILPSGTSQSSGTTPSSFQSYGTTPGYYSTPQYSDNTAFEGINRPQRPQADDDRNAVILSYENTLTPDGEFAFSFDTSNGIHADEAGTSIDGVKANGSYSYIGDDGKVYNVVYTADENGFLPRGDHLPTPPPVPEAIQRVIEQAAKDKEAGIIHDGSYDAERYGPKMYQSSRNRFRPSSQQTITNGADIPDHEDGKNINTGYRKEPQVSSTRKPVDEGDEFDEYVRNENIHLDEDIAVVGTKPGRLPSRRPVNKPKGTNTYETNDDYTEEDDKKPGLTIDNKKKGDLPRRRPVTIDRKHMKNTYSDDRPDDSQDYEKESPESDHNVSSLRQKFDKFGRPVPTKETISKSKTKYVEYDDVSDDQDLPGSVADDITTRPKGTKMLLDKTQRNYQKLDKYGRPVPTRGSTSSTEIRYDNDDDTADFPDVEDKQTTDVRPKDKMRLVSGTKQGNSQKFDTYGRPLPGKSSVSKSDKKYTEYDNESQDVEETDEDTTTGRPKSTKRPSSGQKTNRPLLRTKYVETEESSDEVAPVTVDDDTNDEYVTDSRRPSAGTRVKDQRKQIKKLTESAYDIETEDNKSEYTKPTSRPTKISSNLDGSGYQYIPPQSKFEAGKIKFPTRMPEIERKTKRPGQYETTNKATTLQPFITPNVYRKEESDDEYLHGTADKNRKSSKSGERIQPTTEIYDETDQEIGDEEIYSTSIRPERPGSTKSSGTRRPYGQTTVPDDAEYTYKQDRKPQRPTSRPDTTYSEIPRRPGYGQKIGTSKIPFSSSTTPKPYYEESSRVTPGNSYQTQYPIDSSTLGANPTMKPSSYNRPSGESSRFPATSASSTSAPGYSKAEATVTTEPAITRSGFNQPSRAGFNQPGSQPDYTTPGSVTIRPGRPGAYQDLPSTTYRPNYNLIRERVHPGQAVDEYGRLKAQSGDSFTTANPEFGTPDGRPQGPYGPVSDTTRPSLNYDTSVSSAPGQQGNFAPNRPQFGTQEQRNVYGPNVSPTIGKVIGEDFSGPKQPQRFDPESGYYY